MQEKRKLNGEEIAKVLDAAISEGLTFSVSIHGVEDISTAIDFAEKIGGEATINQQTSCFVVKASGFRSDVNFFVPKTPFS